MTDTKMTAVDVPTITSARDLGFQYAAHEDRGASLALLAKDHIPNFPDSEGDDWLEFNAGCIQRKADITPPRLFVKEGLDNYREITGQKAPKGAETLVLSVGYVMSFSQQQAGSLKKLQPELHRLVAGERTAVNKYVSNKRKRLVAMYKALTAGPRSRDTNKHFTDWLDDICATILKRGKTSADRESNPDYANKAVVRDMVLARLK